MSETTDVAQQYCVRWNSHLCSLSTAFPQLLDQEKFVDVTLACEGHQVKCHQVVLAACSQYFDNLLSENPCKHPIIILPSDIKLWTIQALVEFMYKGQVNVSQAGLPDLVKSGDLLQIRGLCNTDISSGLTVQNNSNTNVESAQVSKVSPAIIPPVAHMASMGKKDTLPSASPTKTITDLRRSSNSMDDEQQIKAEEYDFDDELDSNDDPKNPEKQSPSKDSITITTINEPSSSSHGQIRVKSLDNLFENYDKARTVENQTKQVECDVIEIKEEEEEVPNPVISGQPFSLVNINEDEFFADEYDDHEEPSPPEFYMTKFTLSKNILPNNVTSFASSTTNTSNIFLKKPRQNQVRTYTEEELLSALNEVKAGLSIYKAAKKYRVPRKTLRNWMARWKIKSAHPMPDQLKRAAIKRKEERDQMLASIQPKMEMTSESYYIKQENTGVNIGEISFNQDPFVMEMQSDTSEFI